MSCHNQSFCNLFLTCWLEHMKFVDVQLMWKMDSNISNILIVAQCIARENVFSVNKILIVSIYWKKPMHGTRKCQFWEYDIYCSNLLIEANEKEIYLERKKYIIMIADLKFYENVKFLLYLHKWMDCRLWLNGIPTMVIS